MHDDFKLREDEEDQFERFLSPFWKMSIDFAKKSCCKEDKMMVCFLPPISKSLFRKNEEVLQQEHRERRSADAQSSRFTNLTHNHTYSYSRGGKITTKHVTFKKMR